MLNGIHHAAITCCNYALSKKSYVGILELDIAAERYRAERESYKLDLSLPDGSQIERFSFPGRLSRSARSGTRHSGGVAGRHRRLPLVPSTSFLMSVTFLRLSTRIFPSRNYLRQRDSMKG